MRRMALKKGSTSKRNTPTKTLPITWRVDYPQDPRLRTDLGALIENKNWQVAYGLGAVRFDEQASVALRISTTGPIKVWHNGQVVFSGRRIGDWLFDGITIPFVMQKG